MNGDLRVAYRTSPPGARDIVFVPNWLTVARFARATVVQGLVEAMTSLGRLIFFDQPGTGASDPVTPGALPTLEQWADSITAVLDDLGSREAVLVASDGAFATAALFAASTSVSHHRAGRPGGLCGSAESVAERTDGLTPEKFIRRHGRHVGDWGVRTSASIRTCRGMRRSGQRGRDSNACAASPRTVALMMPVVSRIGRPGAPSDSPRAHPRRPAHRTTRFIRPASGKYIADHIPGAKYVELPGRNMYHFVEPWRESFQDDRRVPHRPAG